MNPWKAAAAVALAFLPGPIKMTIYRRVYGYRIGRGVRIGLTPFIAVDRLAIGDGTRIGSLNVFYRTSSLEIGREVRIGFLNVFRGGERIRIGDYGTILRRNTVNAIVDGDFDEPVDSTFAMGDGAFLSSGHWLDFSAGIVLGENVIVGGRNSSFWTHNRQRGRGIVVGRHTYLGSEVRLAPGVELAPFCIVALGSVLSGRHEAPRMLLGGNPATAVRPIDGRDAGLITRPTRPDVPVDLATRFLPENLRDVAITPSPELGGRDEG